MNQEEQKKCHCGSVQFNYAGRCLACKDKYLPPTPEPKECESCKDYSDGDYGSCGKCMRMLAASPKKLKSSSSNQQESKTATEIAIEESNRIYYEQLERKLATVGVSAEGFKEFAKSLAEKVKEEARNSLLDTLEEEVKGRIEELRKTHDVCVDYHCPINTLQDFLSFLNKQRGSQAKIKDNQ